LSPQHPGFSDVAAGMSASGAQDMINSVFLNFHVSGNVSKIALPE
jgi:hypothetical protein